MTTWDVFEAVPKAHSGFELWRVGQYDGSAQRDALVQFLREAGYPRAEISETEDKFASSQSCLKRAKAFRVRVTVHGEAFSPRYVVAEESDE